MHKLLSFNPEPFEDPAEPQGEPEREVEFAEYETEEELGRRRPRARAPCPTRRKAAIFAPKSGARFCACWVDVSGHRHWTLQTTRESSPEAWAVHPPYPIVAVHTAGLADIPHTRAAAGCSTRARCASC